MSTNTNSSTLTGRLTADAEVKSIGESQLTKLRLAFNHDIKTADGWAEESNFIDLEWWGNRGAGLAPYLVKGSLVCVTGAIRHDRWKAEDGSNRSKHKILVRDLELLKSNVSRDEEGKPVF